MKSINLIKELQKYPIFNLKIIRDILKKNGNYTKIVVYRLKKNGLIFEVEKDKYSVNENALIAASFITWPSYVSGWAGLRFYNLTEQLPQTINVITTRQRKNKKVTFKNVKIEFTKIKPSLFFGYKKERYLDFDIFLGEKEKILIDCALFKLISFSEIHEIISLNIEEINIDKLIDFLKRIKNKTLIKRFGYLLDKLNIDKHNILKKFVDPKYVILDYFLPNKGLKNKKWKVIENAKLE